jgi:DNA-binding protein H-NS
MSENITSLSERELADLIAKAAKELDSKREGKKRETLAQIRKLAASIGVQVEIREADKEPGSKRKGGSIPIKYRDRSNPEHVWTGRGMKPRWLAALLEQGRSIEEFRV